MQWCSGPEACTVSASRQKTAAWDQIAVVANAEGDTVEYQPLPPGRQLPRRKPGLSATTIAVFTASLVLGAVAIGVLVKTLAK